jgi:hypothetical protein
MFRPNYVSSHRRLRVLFVFLQRTAVTDSEKGHPQRALLVTRRASEIDVEAFPLGQKHQQEIEK